MIESPAPAGAQTSARTRQNGAVIRAWRRSQALTQAELGKLAGLGADSISNIEAERRSASEKALRRIAEALGVSPDLIRRSAR